jgi:hypothetical protein
MDSIQTLVSTTQRLPSLRELHIRFDDYVLPIFETGDLVTFAGLAPFINSLSPTLEALSITSWVVNFSQFFLDLGSFPRLRHFALCARFDRAFSSIPDALTLFLRRQSHTLGSVVLQLSTFGGFSFLEPEDPLLRWIISATLDPLILANLNVLDFPATRSDTGFPAFLTLLQRSADTLTELTIRGRYLIYGEVESIISTFSHRPYHMRLLFLKINVRTLSLGLLDLLARELISLEKLSLHITRHQPDGNAHDHEEGNLVYAII